MNGTILQMDWEWFDSPLGNTRLYTGREYNKYTKLYYNRARYYSPELGRFISRDPIDISDDVNLYSYVGNNPVMFTNPTGTVKKWLGENEGNAWYFEKEFFSGEGSNFGHSSLYFIHEGQDYLINFTSYELSFEMISGKNVPGGNVDIYGKKNYIKNKRDIIFKNKIKENYIKINKSKINTEELYNYYSNELKQKNTYNLYTDNCSDEVRKGLVSAGLLKDRDKELYYGYLAKKENPSVRNEIGFFVHSQINAIPNTPDSVYDEVNEAIK